MRRRRGAAPALVPARARPGRGHGECSGAVDARRRAAGEGQAAARGGEGGAGGGTQGEARVREQGVAAHRRRRVVECGAGAARGGKLHRDERLEGGGRRVGGRLARPVLRRCGPPLLVLQRRQQLLVAQRPRGASRGAADKSWRSVRGVKEVTNIVKNSVSASVSGATHASFSGGALLGDAAVLQGTRLLLVFEALPADAVGAKSIDAIKDETPPDLRAELFNTIAMFLYHGHGESYERVSLEVLCAKLGGRLCKYRPEFHIEEKLHEITERFVATTRPKLARASSVHSSSGRSPELLRRDATTPKSKTKKAVSLQEQAIEIPCSAGSKR